MKTVDLNKVLEMLINEEHDEASGLLHEWFVTKTKQAHEALMMEDNKLSQDIEDDQEAIKSEEFYGEAEGDDEVEADVDVDADGVGVDADAEEVVGPDAELELPGDESLEGSVEDQIQDTIEDLDAVMARLKAEFAEITGGEEVSDETEVEAGDEFGAEPFGDEAEVEAEVEETFTVGEVTEAEEDFADLEESWDLEAVKDPNLNGGKEIGAAGAKVAVNDKSPLPEHDADARVGGNVVEIHAEEHSGYDREAAPAVKARPLKKNEVKKTFDGQSKVSKEGDKSAMLNSTKGFGSDSPKSPIGQATDLRGSDFKRK
jgi:hypothetical protein